MEVERQPEESFIYERLDPSKKEIRIIELHPGQGGDDICCKIHHIRLGECSAYETVSYCWGDASLRSTCLLDGHLVSIPLSSGTVLRQARLLNSTRRLWIDALCINQDDGRERDEQVALMREIYSKSSGNLIFLDMDLKRASASLALFGRLWHEAAAFTSDFRDMNLIIGRSGASKDVLSIADTTAFFAAVFSPWFRRVWVMQEAALAPMSSCIIGAWQMPLVDLLRAFRWREYRYHYSADTFVDSTSLNTALRNILTLWRYVDPLHGPYRKQDGASIADALVFARGLNSTQPRDHVFGLLGLIRYRSLPAVVMHKLRPAYSRSILEIFRDATVAALMEADGIPDFIFEEIVYRTDAKSTEQPKVLWPSWVPEWSQPRDLEVHPGRLNKWYFKAAGEEAFDFSEIDDGSIQVRGIIIDAVADATSVCRVREWSRGQDRIRLQEWLTEVDDLAPKMVQQDEDWHRRAINTTLLAGLNGEGQPLQTRDLDAFEVARHGNPAKGGNAPGGSNRLFEVFERTCNNRRFFSTGREYLGIGPHVMKPGDSVVVFNGCRAPVLLRLRNGEYYSIIGECFVHGIMHGEAVSKGGQSSELFTLK